MIRLSVFIVISTIIVLSYYYSINVFDIERQESHEINNATFSLAYFVSLAPVFINAFFTFKWFFVFSLFALIGLIIIPIKIRNDQLYIYPLLIFLAYFFAYTMHYRSYYFIKYGDINKFEALRYITNFFPFYCLIAGYAMRHVYHSFELKIKNAKSSCMALCIILFGYLVFANVSLKNEYYNIEQESRIAPVMETLKNLNPKNSSVITDIPLIFQVFGDDSLVLIDLPSLGRSRNKSITMDMIKHGKNIYYLKSLVTHEKYNYSRWPKAMKFVDSLSLKQINGFKSNDFMLYRVTNSSK